MDGEISPDEVATLLADDDLDLEVRIVDIRDPDSFERGRIPDSENVPFHELPGRIEEFEDADRIVTVCPHGKASVQAARLIGSYEGSADATVESMHGGLEAWVDEYEYDLESASISGHNGTETADCERGPKRDRDRANDDAPDAPF